MSLAEQPYLGDDALAGLLKKAGLRVDLSQIRGLLAGVLAAPAGEHPDAWIDLVAPAADSACRAQLDALKRRLAAEAPPAKLKSATARLAALRKELERRSLAGFLVPRADEHQGEYVPPRAERLAWLTGFTGSAGLAVLLQDAGAIFVDGRYTLQVAQQTDAGLFTAQHLTDQPPEAWIAKQLPKGS